MLAILMWHDRKQWHGEGINYVIACIDLKGIDNRKCSLILQHFSSMPCCLLKEGTATVDQGRERERRFIIKRGCEYIRVLLEKRVDIRESGQEGEERLTHGFIALLHLLIGQVC